MASLLDLKDTLLNLFSGGNHVVSPVPQQQPKYIPVSQLNPIAKLGYYSSRPLAALNDYVNKPFENISKNVSAIPQQGANTFQKAVNFFPQALSTIGSNFYKDITPNVPVVKQTGQYLQNRVITPAIQTVSNSYDVFNPYNQKTGLQRLGSGAMAGLNALYTYGNLTNPMGTQAANLPFTGFDALKRGIQTKQEGGKVGSGLVEGLTGENVPGLGTAIYGNKKEANVLNTIELVASLGIPAFHGIKGIFKELPKEVPRSEAPIVKGYVDYVRDIQGRFAKQGSKSPRILTYDQYRDKIGISPTGNTQYTQAQAGIDVPKDVKSPINGSVNDVALRKTVPKNSFTNNPLNDNPLMQGRFDNSGKFVEEPLPWETLEFKKKNPQFGVNSTPEGVKTNNQTVQNDPEFLNAIDLTARQYNKGQGIPGKVNIFDKLRTPENVLEKIGLGNEARNIRNAYESYKTDLNTEINRISDWQKRAPSPESAVNIFRYLDAPDSTSVKLNSNELKITQEIKSYLSQWADKLGLPKEKRVSSYITHIFENDPKGVTSPELMGILTDKVPGSVYDPFLQKRYGKAGYVENVWRALDAYVKRATRKFNMDPALKRMSQSAEGLDTASYNYVKNYGERINMRPTEVDTLLDNFIKDIPGVGGRYTNRPVNRISQNIRQTIGRAALGLNPSSALRNLTQGVNTYAVLGEKYTAAGYLNMFKNLRENGLQELKDNHILDDNMVQDRRFNAIKSFWEKTDSVLFKMFDWAEKINRGSAYYGAKSKALAQGKSEVQAIEYAKKIVRQTQFTFGSVDTPQIFSSDIAKTIGQFQSYNLKQAEFLTGLFKNKQIVPLARYIGASLLLANTFGKLFNAKPTDMIPFFDQAQQAYGAVTGQDTGSQKFSTPLTTIGSGLISLKDINNGDEKVKSNAVNNVMKAVSLAVPAGVAGKRAYEGADAFLKGASYSPTTGKKQFDIPQDPLTGVRSILFGKSTLPDARNYYAKIDNYYSNQKSELSKLSKKEQFLVQGLPTVDPSDPVAKQEKYTIIKSNPAVYDYLKNMAFSNAGGSTAQMDPFYTTPYQTAKNYAIYESQNPGSTDKKDFLKAHPEVLQLIKDRQQYFEQNPIPGQSSSGGPPQASARAQSLMDAGNFKDPEVQAYLQANTVYQNEQRAKLGLPPNAGYGAYQKKPKKLSIKLSKPSSSKLPAFKLSKAPTFKIAKNTIKLSKIKQPKTTKFKIAGIKTSFRKNAKVA